MKKSVSKIQVAEIQLNDAIYLFFSQANPLVVETLIGATIGVLRALGKKLGVDAPLHDSDIIRSDKKRIWINHLHKAQNFCKHAENDSGDTLIYETEMVTFHIFEACYLFRHLSSNNHLKYHQSTPAILYELWFSMKYPKFLKNPNEFYSFWCEMGLPESFNPDDWEMLKLVAERHRII